jgi:hypothetical protein
MPVAIQYRVLREIMGVVLNPEGTPMRSGLWDFDYFGL